MDVPCHLATVVFGAVLQRQVPSLGKTVAEFLSEKAAGDIDEFVRYLREPDFLAKVLRESARDASPDNPMWAFEEFCTTGQILLVDSGANDDLIIHIKSCQNCEPVVSLPRSNVVLPAI